LAIGQGWVVLDEVHLSQKGGLTPSVPYDTICIECADEPLAIIEKCNKDCGNCDVTDI